MIRVAINGYGRIGRVAHRIILEKFSKEIDVVAINAGSSTDLKGWMYLLKLDSNYGVLEGHEFSTLEEVSEKTGQLGYLSVDSKKIPFFSQKDPSLLPWGEIGVDVVLECTGHFLTQDKAKLLIDAGAKKVVMSAPSKDDSATYLISVNENDYKGENIISNASCTTNSITPIAKIIDDELKIEKAMMTTIHAYTSDQELLDGGHKDYRRARSAAKNTVPTTTGATKAAGLALPSLKGIFEGLAIRVPVSVGSLSDFTFLVKTETDIESVNKLFKMAEKEAYKGIIQTTSDPWVSSDVVGNSHSSVVDLSLTQVVGGNMVKVVAWYDNEWGYATRLVELAHRIGNING